MRRRSAFTAALLSVVLAAAGCTNDPAPRPTPSPGDSDTPVTWQDCRDEARENNPDLPRSMRVECGTVRVPQDWNNAANGETFDIAVMRIFSGDADDKQGSVLTNPGGPGGSGLDFLPYLAPKLNTLMDEFAIVSFDPRGVGKSAPVDCISDADLDASFGYEPDPVSQEAFDGNVAIARRIAEGCGSKYGEDLSLFSTEQTARDMDAIRGAVGDEKLTYLGYSYGTLLGAVYAQILPNKVRALVLDGAVDPQQDPVESSEGQAIGFERALTNFTAWCKTRRPGAPSRPTRRRHQRRTRQGPHRPGQGQRRPVRHRGLDPVGRDLRDVLPGLVAVRRPGNQQPEQRRRRPDSRHGRRLRRARRKRALQQPVRRQ